MTSPATLGGRSGRDLGRCWVGWVCWGGAASCPQKTRGVCCSAHDLQPHCPSPWTWNFTRQRGLQTNATLRLLVIAVSVLAGLKKKKKKKDSALLRGAARRAACWTWLPGGCPSAYAHHLLPHTTGVCGQKGALNPPPALPSNLLASAAPYPTPTTSDVPRYGLNVHYRGTRRT